MTKRQPLSESKFKSFVVVLELFNNSRWLRRLLHHTVRQYSHKSQREVEHQRMTDWMTVEHLIWPTHHWTQQQLLTTQPQQFALSSVTLWTSCLHVTLSSEYMSVLSNVYPVHWRMLSIIHVAFGLSLVWDPGVVHCIIISFSKLSDFFLVICLKYDNFLAFTDSSRFLDAPALSRPTQPFECFAVHDTRIVSDEVLAFQKSVSFFHCLLGRSNLCSHELLQVTLALW